MQFRVQIQYVHFESFNFPYSVSILKKYFKDGKILMPYAIGPLFGNCLMATLLNDTLPREKMDGLFR